MKVKLQIHKRKKETSRVHLLLFIGLALALFFVLSFYRKDRKGNIESVSAEKKALNQLHQVQQVPPPLKENREIIRRGMTLTDVLKPYGFSPTAITNLRKEVQPVYDLSKIKAGHEFRVYCTKEGEVASLEYDIDGDRFLCIQTNEGKYTAEIKKVPYDFEIKMIHSVIEDNPISAVIKQNEKSILALNLADLFGWDIDFNYDLRQGDSFKILFEKKYLRGESIGYGNILAAEFINQGKVFQAFRYTYPDTNESDYFTLDGKSLRKEFLKSPIRFTRITSRFSYSRLHPIYKVFRPHLGVDYAARVGTPVQATADGTVTSAGWQGPSGRMITIRHKNEYETMYLHLRGFAEGIRKGAKVRSGQEIGYVGASGEATGPHLDYRIKHRGRFINPLAFNPEPVKPLRAEYYDDFQKQAEKYYLCFEAPLCIYSCLSNAMMQPW